MTDRRIKVLLAEPSFTTRSALRRCFTLIGGGTSDILKLVIAKELSA